MTELNVVNLFCGMGGDEIGIRDAVYTDLKMAYKGLSVNHWDVAVATMRANFPNVTALDCKIEEAVTGDLVPWGTQVHLLWASPSCTHHSRAKGGMPRCNQLRSQPEYVTTWIAQTRPWCVIVENVPEFREWGPLDDEGLPDKAHKGETFTAWLKMVESLGYNVEHRVLCCADYGDATSRKRFFLISVRRDVGSPVWPKPTHGDHVPGLPQWRGAGECLDLSELGQSIFGRKRPLAEKTLARLADGAQKYLGLDITTGMLVKACGEKQMKPFIVKLNRGATTEDIDAPLTTVMSGGNHHALCQLVRDHQNRGKAEPLDRPLKTKPTHDRSSLMTLVLGQHGAADCRPATEPVPTVACKGAVRMIEPVVIDNANGGIIRKSREPLNAVTLKDRHMMALPVLEDGRRIDIFMRMLTPRELARAHSVPDDFVITGNKTEQTKQVVNSVPVRTARALVRALLERYAKLVNLKTKDKRRGRKQRSSTASTCSSGTSPTETSWRRG